MALACACAYTEPLGQDRRLDRCETELRPGRVHAYGVGRVGARPTHALAEATPELTPRPRFVAMARWYRGSVLDRTRDCLDGRRPSPAPAPLQRLRPRPSTGQHRRWWSIRTRTPKKQYLEKRRVATCPGQSARRRRLSTLVISHHALLTHRHVLEVRRLLRLAVPAPPVPRVTPGAL